MAQGTGLPLPKPGNDLSQAPSINADAVSSAAAWTKISAAGAQIEKAGFDTLERAVHLQQAGAVADFENEWRLKNIEARDRYTNGTPDKPGPDPEGFKTWAQSTIDGAVSQAPPWMAAHVKSYLSRTFDGSYASILGTRRAQDDRIAADALNTRRVSADDDVMSLAAGGKVGTSEFNAAVAVHNSVLETAVKSGAMSPEKADYLRDDLAGRAQGEVAARQAVQVYREKGFDEAVGYLTKNVRDNPDLTLKSSQRDKVFNRGLAAVRLEQSRDKEDRGAAVELSKDIRARLDSNQDVDPGEIKTVADELARTGAFTERRNLIIRAGVYDATQAYKPGGGKTLPQLGADIARMRNEVTPGVRGAIEAAASRRGVDPNYLIRTANRESGFNPNAQSQTSSAGGLFQFVDQTWLAQLKASGADIGLGDLAAKIQKDGGRYIVTDPAAREQIFALRKDPAVNADMAAAFTAQNAQILRGALGREPSGGELYAAHFLGADGAVAMLKADRSAKASDINPAAAASNSTIFFAKDGRAKTVGEVLNNLTRTATEGPDQPVVGQITKGVQQFYVAQERKVWPEMKKLLENGRITDPTEFEAVRYAAQISGDQAWANEVETFAAARGYGRLMRDAPESAGQAVLDRVRQKLEANGGTVGDRQVFDLVQKQYDRQVRMAREDPIGLALETDPGLKSPLPLNFGDPNSAKQGFMDRVSLARRTAESKETPLGSPLRPADRAATAAIITRGPIDQTKNAFDMLASAADDALLPTLSAKEIKEAVGGATKSTDPARYEAAMTFLDRIWQRAPESVDNLFGSDAVHDLAAWQTKRRYMSAEDIAKDRSKAALDPQVRERQRAAFNEGLEIARKVKPDDVVGKFDQSWWVTPGVVARNVTGTQPIGPGDPVARAALMGDWQQNVARVYADTLDKDKALEKGTEITRTKWTASPTNGGKLMLNAPEKYYPSIGGSWDWMRSQIEQDIAKTGLGPRTTEVTPLAGSFVPGSQFFAGGNWDWEIVPDRQTEAEAQAGQKPSYLVRITDNRKGGAISILPQRYRWDTDAGPGNPVETFQRQRARVLEDERDRQPMFLPGGF